VRVAVGVGVIVAVGTVGEAVIVGSWVGVLVGVAVGSGARSVG